MAMPEDDEAVVKTVRLLVGEQDHPVTLTFELGCSSD